jgi:hypothetical protein
MSNLDVMTTLLVRVLGIDPTDMPAPIMLLGFTMTVIWVTLLVWLVWTILRVVFTAAADMIEVRSSRQRVVIARGLTRHDFDQIRNGIRAWRVLLVRHGSDDYLRDMAGDADRHAGRTRRDVIAMKLTLSSVGEAVLSWRLPIHQRLGTQFRCFAVPRDDNAGGVAITGMLQLFDEIDALPAETTKPTRIYFLLRSFRVIAAADGAKQNLVLPE